MKKLMFLAIAICGIQIASAQTLTPASKEKKQHAPVPLDKKMDHSTTKSTEKKSGSTGTYTTGASVPSPDLPSDTTMDSKRNPRPVTKPSGDPRE
jgi:hypothetical protein